MPRALRAVGTAEGSSTSCCTFSRRLSTWLHLGACLLARARHILATLSKAVEEGLHVAWRQIPRREVVDSLAKVRLHESPKVGVAPENVKTEFFIVFKPLSIDIKVRLLSVCITSFRTMARWMPLLRKAFLTTSCSLCPSLKSANESREGPSSWRRP